MELLAGLLPFAIFLVCPLMMIFMMRGMMHGGHGGHQSDSAPDREPDGATARKLAAMELEIARLRGELDVDRSSQPDAERSASGGGRT